MVVLEVAVIVVVVAFVVQPLTPAKAVKAEPSCAQGRLVRCLKHDAADREEGGMVTLKRTQNKVQIFL